VFNRVTVTVMLLLCFACTRKSEVVRPERVPSDATYVAGGKLGGWWQECTSVTPGQSVHCRIWNGAGRVLEDEDFLPYDGGTAPAADTLRISTDPSVPGGPDRVFLSNGRILLPRSRFDELKKFIDWLKTVTQLSLDKGDGASKDGRWRPGRIVDNHGPFRSRNRRARL
jgi:hypothetical protein